MKIAWGLEAQGHIPTIEEMLDHGSGWDDIARSIGWEPDTARRHYHAYLQKRAEAIKEMDKA